MNGIDYSSSVISELHLPVGQVKTEFSSLAKSTSPGLLSLLFFARCEGVWYSDVNTEFSHELSNIELVLSLEKSHHRISASLSDSILPIIHFHLKCCHLTLKIFFNQQR